MLTSPITITIDGVAHNLSRINNSEPYAAVYLKKATGLELRCTIRHAYEGKAGPLQMERHNVDLVHTTWDVDGNAIVRQTYHVIRTPRSVDTDVANKATIGLNAWLTSNVALITGWES